MTNIVNGHDLDTQSGRADFRQENPGNYVEGNSSGGGYTYQTASGQTGQGGGTQTPTQGATYNTGGTSTPSSPSAPTNTTSALSGTDQQMLNRLIQGQTQLLNAAAQGNEEAFKEAIRQFDAEFGLDKDRFAEGVRQYNEGLSISQAGLTGQYQGAQTLQGQQQAFNQAVTAAGLTGYYQQPAGMGMVGGASAQPVPVQTLAGQQQQFAQQQALAQMYGQAYTGFGQGQPGGVPQGASTLAAQQQAYQQGTGLVQQVSALQANPFRQQTAMGQLSRLLGGQSVSGFGQTGTVPGAGTGGLGYLQQMIDDIREPSANQQSMQGVLNGIPTPNKMDSVQFFKAPQTTQNLVLQGMSEKYGIDPQDALAQIKNTMPGFQAPQTYGTVRRPTF